MDEQMLINTLKKIAKSIEDSENMAKEKKENFNVLECLTRFHLEELHSNFLGYLLDPKASHGCGGDFLKEFLSQVNFPEIEDPLNANIVLEKFIGRKAENKEYYGFIDVYIELDKHLIVIENKLTAKDQEDQLLRYHNYCQKFHNDKIITIFYLTLWGTASAEAEKLVETSNFDYINISYRHTIINWLESCIEISGEYPSQSAVNGINTYLNLLKKRVLHIPTNESMKNIKKLFEQENISQVLVKVDSIKEALSTVRNQMLEDFWGMVKEVVSKELTPEWEIDFMREDKVDYKHGHLGLYHKDRKNLHVAFENLYYKQGNTLDNCILTLWKDPRIKAEVKEYINKEFLIHDESWIIFSEKYGHELTNDEKIYQKDSHFELAQEYAKRMLKFASDHLVGFKSK